MDKSEERWKSMRSCFNKAHRAHNTGYNLYDALKFLIPCLEPPRPSKSKSVNVKRYLGEYKKREEEEKATLEAEQALKLEQKAKETPADGVVKKIMRPVLTIKPDTCGKKRYLTMSGCS